MEFEHNGQQYIVDFSNTKDIRATKTVPFWSWHVLRFLGQLLMIFT